MKDPIKIIIILILVAFGIGAYMLSQKSSTKSDLVMKDNTSIQTDKSGNSRYVEYSKSTLDQSVGNRRVLFFYANWCSTCRPTDVNLKENTSKIPDDVTVIRVNYNDTETDQEEKDLAKEYGIVYQHTFVQIDAQGNEVTRWSGGQIEELLSNIK